MSTGRWDVPTEKSGDGAWSGADGPPGAVDEAVAVLESMRGLWDEEAVDELDHARQSAGRAIALHPDDDEFTVAALLHDIARAPALALPDARDHAAAARSWLTPRFGVRVGWLAGSHVVAKRHLSHVDPAYAAALSPVSVRSLSRQGGAAPVDPEWTEHEWWPDALELRRCDDAAKVPGAAAPTVSDLRAVLSRVAARQVRSAASSAGRR